MFAVYKTSVRSVAIAVVGLLAGCSPGESSQGAGGSSASAVQIASFTAEKLWGDAPLETKLLWQIDAPVETALECELDTNGDGTFETSLPSCPESGSHALTLADAGKFEPTLRVTANGKSVEAKELIYVNHIEWAPNLIRVQSLPGLVSSALSEDDTTVTLVFATTGDLPAVESGAVVWDEQATGFVRRAVAASTEGAALVLTVEGASILDIGTGGFWGRRSPAAEGGQQPMVLTIDDCEETELPDDWAVASFGIPETWIISEASNNIDAKIGLTDGRLLHGISPPDVVFDFWAAKMTAVVLVETRVCGNVQVSGKWTKPWEKPIPLPFNPLGKAIDFGLFKASAGLVPKWGGEISLEAGMAFTMMIGSQTKLELVVKPGLPTLLIPSVQPKGYFDVTGTGEYKGEAKIYVKPEVELVWGNPQKECVNKKTVHNGSFKLGVSDEFGLGAFGELSVGNSAEFCLEVKIYGEAKVQAIPPFKLIDCVEVSAPIFAIPIYENCWPLGEATCDDATKNDTETDVDCGGSCPECANGKTCSDDVDCQSGACNSGTCGPAAQTCNDGIKNGTETDVDCGGACSDCPVGKKCGANGDCASGSCKNGFCAAAPSCNDGVKNVTETDVDCGGSCAACGTGKTCTKNTDCESGQCSASVCVSSATCADGIKNQGETGIDCGGPCAPCATCNDGVKNQGEMGVDCGGPCPTCLSCNDGVKNQGETGIDCGGPCPACPTCSDGVKNQGETGIDCGSPCPACATCSDGTKNQGEVNVDCGGPCPTCTCPGPGTQGCQNCGTQTRTCNADGTWSAWGPCLGQNNCPAGQACDGNINVCVACGGFDQACCSSNLCQAAAKLVCYAGSCASCGTIGQPCCDANTIGLGGAACADSSLACMGGLCQPQGNTPVVVFQEDFENLVWDHIGQGILPDGIAVWDVDQSLHTSLGSGAPPSLEGFVWHGGGMPASIPPSAATMTMPGGLLAGLDVVLSFDASSASGLDIVVGRAGCPMQTVTVPSQTWTHKTLALNACGSTSHVVFQVGVVYGVPANLAALTLDNIKVKYVYPEVCDGLDNDGDGLTDENGVCPVCQDECALGSFGCQDATTELDCFAPTFNINCNHYDNPHACSAGSGCFAGVGCQPCGGLHEQCCPGGACNSGKTCWQGASCEIVLNGCVDGDGDGYLAAACGGTDCGDSNILVHPGVAEACNQIDDNCNGQIDEGLANCPQQGPCMPTNGGVETCDGKDNDCNGSIDGIFICPLDAIGNNCIGGINNCTYIGQIHCVNQNGICVWDSNNCVPYPENCFDAIDNDCNGATDGADPACQ